MGDRPVVVFLSTGQCGLQWLTSGLRALHPGLDVRHEPIGAQYKPRYYFRRYRDPESMLQEPEIAAHVREIDHSRAQYVETGWTSFAALPLLADRLGERLRVVHLTRHPVPTALLNSAAELYADSSRDDTYTRYATLSARDRGVIQSHYSTCWEELSSYERCLFWWTEVHLFGIELPGMVDDMSYLRVKSEDLLSGDRTEIERMLDFMELEWSFGWLRHSRHQLDRWHEHGHDPAEALEVHRHPIAVEVARELGYDLSGLTVGALDLLDRSA